MVDVTIPANRSRPKVPDNVRLHYAPVSDDENEDGVTSPLRTAIDVARSHRFATSLTIAEAVVRNRRIDPGELVAAAEKLRGPGSAKARRVMRAIDVRAQSVMESFLRGSLIATGITSFQPQFEVPVNGTPLHADLGDKQSRILIEADSFTWHGHRGALAADCERYDEFVAAGYVVLRFAYEHLLYSADWVLEVVRRALAART